VAIGRISGALLFSDLDRQGTDLAFTTNGKPLVYMDFTNFRFGVNTNSVVDTFTVTGTANISGITKVFGNLVAASGTAASSATTGALVVVGGAGIGGAVYTGGNIQIQNTTNAGLTTNQATAYVFNETATIVKIAGGGVAEFDSNTQATSTTTGAIQLTGGMSVNTGNVYIGGSGGNAVVTTSNIYAGNVFITTGLSYAGNGAPFTANSANWIYIVESTDDNNAYNIPYIGPTTSGVSNDAPKQLYSDTALLTFNPGTNTFTTSTVTATGSLVASGNTQATSTTTGVIRSTGGLSVNTGNVYIGGSGGNAIVSTGDIYNRGNIWATATSNTGLKTNQATAYVFNETATIVKIAGAGVAEFDSNLQATSTTTGAIQLAGGMSIASGNLYIAGSAGRSITAIGNVTVTGDTSTSISTGAVTVVGGVGVNGNVNAVTLTGNLTSTFGDVIISPLATNANAVVVINATSALQLPAGTTGQQPAAYAGAIRWNISTNNIEYYTGSSWISFLSQINNQTISPDGLTAAFTLDYSTTAEGVIVSINGTLQAPGAAYTVAGTTITFAEIPLVTDIISIRFIASGTVTAENAQEINAANLTLTTGAVLIDSFNTGVYRSAKYLSSSTSSTGSEFAEFAVTHFGSTVAVSNVNRAVTGTALATITANISGSLVSVYATASSSAQMRLQKTYFII
jgi:hypothetical protein